MSAVLLLLLFLLSCAAARDRHQLEMTEHYAHLDYLAEFPCGQPRPQVLQVCRLFPQDELQVKAMFPDVTVLHRCDQTGTCSSGRACVVSTSETVLLPFKVTFLRDTDHHKQGSWRMESRQLVNHTSCACASPTTQPDTRKLSRSKLQWKSVTG